MFCNRCGFEIVPGAAFCAKCGAPVSSAGSAASQNPQQMRENVFSVSFIREKQWFAINPAVKVLIDDRDEYAIDNGKTIRIPMTAGTHSVAFRSGIRNKIIELDVQRDLEIHLKWSRVTGSLVVN